MRTLPVRAFCYDIFDFAIMNPDFVNSLQTFRDTSPPSGMKTTLPILTQRIYTVTTLHTWDPFENTGGGGRREIHCHLAVKVALTVPMYLTLEVV